MRKKYLEESIVIEKGGIWTDGKTKKINIEVDGVPNIEDRLGMSVLIRNGDDIGKKLEELKFVKSIPCFMEVPENGIGIWDINNNRIFQLPMGVISDRSKKKVITVNQIGAGSKIEISPHPFRELCDIELELHGNSRISKNEAVRYLCKEDAEYLSKVNCCDIVFANFDTGKIVPIRKSYARFFIGDFELHINFIYYECTRIKCEVTHMPVQAKAV